MDASKEISHILVDLKMNQRELAERLEMKQQTLNKRMNENSWRVYDFSKVLNNLGYELKITQKEK